ncbi:MAG TPA: hypothetical protein PL110_11335 [Candidatus Eremiobacteraeota bacterium]|nr:hypothetical protein [Candidatus Eremiobacteraeota bacterium]
MGAALGNMMRQSAVNSSQSRFNRELAQGARSGQLNRNEFMYLSQFDQQTRQLEGQFLKDGNLSPQEKSILDQRMAYSRQMLELYKRGDFHPFTQGPTNQIEAREQNQLNRIYSGLRDGSLAQGIFGRDEGAMALDRVGDISTNYGKAQFGGGYLTPGAWGSLNNQLNNSSANIYNLRHNWLSGPSCPLPDNVSWGPFGGFGQCYW